MPGFGPADAPLGIVGLAPATHGGNRTVRIFTGAPSGDALYAAPHDIGLASQPTATHRGDGLELYGVRITVPVHCAPPDNRASTGARDTFRHGADTLLADSGGGRPLHLAGSYHPGQRNMSTRTLTPPCSGTYCAAAPISPDSRPGRTTGGSVGCPAPGLGGPGCRGDRRQRCRSRGADRSAP